MTVFGSKICVVCMEEMPPLSEAKAEIFNPRTGARRHPKCEGKPLKIKVFKMNDCDWMAAKTITEAKKAYLELVVLGSLDDDEAFDDPSELGPKAMAHFRYHDTDQNTSRSFQDELEARIARGVVFPEYFATTEY